MNKTSNQTKALLIVLILLLILYWSNTSNVDNVDNVFESLKTDMSETPNDIAQIDSDNEENDTRFEDAYKLDELKFISHSINHITGNESCDHCY